MLSPFTTSHAVEVKQSHVEVKIKALVWSEPSEDRDCLTHHCFPSAWHAGPSIAPLPVVRCHGRVVGTQDRDLKKQVDILSTSQGALFLSSCSVIGGEPRLPFLRLLETLTQWWVRKCLTSSLVLVSRAKESLPEWVVVYALFSFLLCPRAGPVQSPCFLHLPFPSSILSFLICWRRQNPPGLGAGWSSGLWVAGGLRALPFTKQCFDSWRCFALLPLYCLAIQLSIWNAN